MVKGKYTNFILSGVRRSRGQVIAIVFLLVIVAALLNTFLFLTFDYSENFPREAKRLDATDCDFLFTDMFDSDWDNEKVADVLRGIDEIKDFEIDDTVSGKGFVEFGDAILTNNVSLMRFDYAKSKKIGRYEILESDGGNGAYLSYIFKVDGGYSVGDTIGVTVGNEEYTFRIAGFYNSVDTGTTNCNDIAVLLTDDEWDGLDTAGRVSYRIGVTLVDPDKADLWESDIAAEISNALPTMMMHASSSVRRLATSRYVTATIFKAIISASAILMIAVVFVIICVTLSNYLRNNIRSLGTLKAVGYTSGNLIIPIVLEFSAIALAAAAVGVALSYLLFPVLNNALERQTGMPYHIRFMPVEALVSVGICIAVAALSSFFSVVKIRRIHPINAIRDTRTGGKIRTNFFPLDKTKTELNTALSLKAWASGTARNLIIFFSMASVAFLIGFSCASYQNVILDTQNILDMVCGQMTDSVIGVDVSLEDELIDEIKDNGSVERYYLFSIIPVTPIEMPKMYAYVVDSAEYLDEDRICIDGRFPKSDDEIAVNGTYAQKSGVKTGDRLTFDNDGEEVGFTVTGIVQGAYYSGRDCYLTRNGYLRFNSLHVISYYIDLKDGCDTDSFNREIGENCDIVFSSDYRKSVDTVSKSYIRILTIATAIVVVLSFAIAGFILYILISVLLSNKKREHGILKSLGFVTRDIIYQTVVSFMPTCIVATVVGLWISRTGATALLVSALNGIGIFSFGTPTRLVYLLAAGLAIILFTALYSVLLSGSVRHITPHRLFNNE